MSVVKDFFQDLGNVLTFGLIPPAIPHLKELSEEDLTKLLDNVTLSLDTSMNPPGLDTDKIMSDVDLLLKETLGDFAITEKLPTKTDPLTTGLYPPSSTYIPNGPMYPYK